MEDHEFCDDCSGCRPAIMNPQTGEVLANDSPEMIRVNEVWDTQTNFDQRRAFIQVTLKNSRKPDELRLAEQVIELIKNVL